MFEMSLTVRYNGGSIRAFRKVMERRGIVPEFGQAFRKIDRDYRLMLRRRFRKASQGGTTWRKNAPSTQAAKGHGRILINTQTMYNAFQPKIKSTPNIRKPSVRPQVQLLYTKTDRTHPSGPRISQLLRWHQEGTKRMPARKVIVGMDRRTAKKSAKHLENALDKYHNRVHSV